MPIGESVAAEGCAEIGSPWIDGAHRYYAILAMQIDSTSDVVAFSIDLQQAWKPLIVQALAE